MKQTPKVKSQKRAAKPAALLSKGEMAELIEMIGAAREAFSGPFANASDTAYVAMLGRIQAKLRRLTG